MPELLGGRCRYLILHGCVHSSGLGCVLAYDVTFGEENLTSVVRRT